MELRKDQGRSEDDKMQRIGLLPLNSGLWAAMEDQPVQLEFVVICGRRVLQILPIGNGWAEGAAFLDPPGGPPVLRGKAAAQAASQRSDEVLGEKLDAILEELRAQRTG